MPPNQSLHRTCAKGRAGWLIQAMNDLHNWIGRHQTTTDTLGLRLTRWMAATLDRADLLDPQHGVPLPLGWHWMFFNRVERRSGVGPDGHPLRGRFLPPVTLPRRMWAGSRLHWHRPLLVGSRVAREATILRVEQKSGRNGHMVFVTVGYAYRDGASLLLEEEQDIVYRGNPGDDERAALALIEARAAGFSGEFERRGEHVECVETDPVLLFRYSAATFNGHRIHYDLPYAVSQEGYPGLVVHGPLIATLLLGMLERHAGPRRMVERFEFRAKRPTFCISPFHLHLSEDAAPDEVKLWSTSNVGEMALDCSASLRRKQA